MAAPYPKYTAKDLQLKIDECFENNPDKPTVTGLAYFLGFESRQSMYDYQKRDSSSYTIKRAVLRIEEKHEANLFGGQSTGSIFWLKNRDWTDKQSIDHTTDGDKITGFTLEVIHKNES